MPNETFTIEIKDDKGRVVEIATGVDEYFAFVKSGQTFKKIFSHNDYTVQLGLIDFAQAQLIAEIIKKA